MRINDLEYFKNKKVLVVLHNGYKITTTMPLLITQTLKLVDKYNKVALVDVNDITTIVEVMSQ